MQRNLLSMSQIVVPNMPFYVNLLKLFDVISSNNVIYLLNYISISKNFLSSFKLRLLHFLYFFFQFICFYHHNIVSFPFCFRIQCVNFLRLSLLQRIKVVLDLLFQKKVVLYSSPSLRLLSLCLSSSKGQGIVF